MELIPAFFYLISVSLDRVSMSRYRVPWDIHRVPGFIERIATFMECMPGLNHRRGRFSKRDLGGAMGTGDAFSDAAQWKGNFSPQFGQAFFV